MSYSVYILRCADDSLYTGSTNKLAMRIKQHNEQVAGAHYTKTRRPVTLVYTETADSLGAARKREAEIKRLTRKEKLKLIDLHV